MSADGPIKIAVLRGPFLRPNGVIPWEGLHQHCDRFNVTYVESDPARFDTSVLSAPVIGLPWPEGRIKVGPWDQFFSRSLRKLKFPSNYLRGVKQVVEDHDLVHVSENFHIFSMQAAWHTRRVGKKLAIAVGENIPFPPFQNNPVTHRVKRYVGNTAELCTTTTTAGMAALKIEGVDSSKIRILPNAVDTDLFVAMPKNPASVGLPDDLRQTFNILHVHKLSEQKGVPWVVEAFAKLVSEYPAGVRLILVGGIDKSLSPSTLARIRAMEQRGTVIHMPLVVPSLMPTLYNIADITVLASVRLPNNREQFGIAVIEAMSCGKPTVVTDVGGLPYVVDPGRTSIVVQERSSEQLYRAFKRLQQDTGFRKSLSETGIEWVGKHYTPERVARQLHGYYSELLSVSSHQCPL